MKDAGFVLPYTADTSPTILYDTPVITKMALDRSIFNRFPKVRFHGYFAPIANLGIISFSI